MREDKIRKLIAILQEHEDIVEVESLSGPFGISRLRVSRRTTSTHAGLAHAPAVSTSDAPPAPATQSMDGVYEVKAPMVGTFYRAPNPGAEPFIQEGSKVKSGTVLCIIEAMKLMNEIECGVSGTVTEVPVENGAAIEYGQVLMRIQED